MAILDNLEAMLVRGQDNALVRYGIGAEYAKLNQPDKAAEHLRQAVKKDPKYSAAWKLLGQVLTDAGHQDEAIAAYNCGITVAQEKGDKQAAKEMAVFLKRITKI
ncbi:MAG: tetratricopeptide repeat protein [Sulfuricaulis sp.]